MKLLVLAAGYATRLYPLTLNQSKSLLEVAGQPMIEHILATTEDIGDIDHIFIVTNKKFTRDFKAWAVIHRQTRPNVPPITVVNDRSTDDSNKLGAIGDIKLVIDSQKISDDLLVIGGDNLFNSSLAEFAKYALRHGPTLGVYDVGDLEQMKKYGNVSVDGKGRIIKFVEKPSQPKTTLAAMCLYYYPRTILPLIDQYVKEGNSLDQPGHFIAWLYQRQPVYAHQIRGQWLDIGSFETLELARRLFAPEKHL
ncbi:MAG: nucleotidyltransferase family protein [Verrucomicrobiia bacterium]|jgi:glucose-1-phosphate thymidylyltransferase